MMQGSLRLRLFVIILLPLLLISVAIGIWRIGEAQNTAQELFDRSLLFTALAVSRDVALLDGDAISPDTERLLGTTAGGPVRYHVYAPDGVFVTGYAVPPVPVGTSLPQNETFTYLDAVYKGDDVRVLRLKYVTRIGEFTGPFTVTVWQAKAAREQFVRALALRAFAVIVVLIGTAAFMVWFGVNLGLKPLLDLEDAVSRRGPEDLSPIQRRVPVETEGLVERLNRLFRQVNATMEAQVAFISDASHQLRNPIAGVRALGEAILTAPSLDTARARARDLIDAAERTGNLAESLITLERARAALSSEPPERVDLVPILRSIVADFEGPALDRNVDLALVAAPATLILPAEATMLREAIVNLLDNALLHGGDGVSKIVVRVTDSDAAVDLTVEDDGRGVPPEAIPKIRARFGQADPSSGSGLGLSIAEAVAERHGGMLRIHSRSTGFAVTLTLPKETRMAA